MVFVDTSFWVALFDRSERSHARVRTVWQRDSTMVITSDYVFDETVTVLKARVDHRASVAAGQAMLSSPRVTMEPVTDADRRQAWETFRSHEDKPWSFTDCTSKVLIDRLGCTQVWALDVDFHQMGYLVLP